MAQVLLNQPFREAASGSPLGAASWSLQAVRAACGCHRSHGCCRAPCPPDELLMPLFLPAEALQTELPGGWIKRCDHKVLSVVAVWTGMLPRCPRVVAWYIACPGLGLCAAEHVKQ